MVAMSTSRRRVPVDASVVETARHGDAATIH
jgi:hypothetical protein